MQFVTILGLMGICAISSFAMVTPNNNPADGAVVAPPVSNLYQDFKELKRMIFAKPIRRLISRYLLNDAEFQTFVRIINSQDAYITRTRFRSQPEVVSFITWLRTQIMLSGGKFSSEESNEVIKIYNRSPYWANNVAGWQGFVNEFMMYYPQDMIRAHVEMMATQNVIFAEMIQRLKALKPVYDRVIALPEAQRVIAALQANGIDAVALDTFIRNQFGWQQLATAVASSPIPNAVVA